jgi:aromatic-L-amino-acid decarboxylase
MGLINAEGDFYLSHTVLNGRTVLRIAIGNLGTTRDTLQRLWTRLREVSASLIA